MFFATISVLVLAGSLSPMLDRDAGPAHRAPIGHLRPKTTRAPAQGCVLRMGTQTVTLSIALAMKLTDQAGRDQNVGASLPSTAAAVARLWPAEAAAAVPVASALRGLYGTALSCVIDVTPVHVEAMTADGLTPRANSMWDSIKGVFGALPAGGFMPGGVTQGHLPGSAHYEGRAIDFFYRPVTAKTIQHGSVLAQWLVAHAAQLAIANVIFDATIWSADTSQTLTWAPYTYPDGPTTNLTLLHYDHVHVDVERGS